MKSARALVFATGTVIAVAALLVALCPRPALYGDIQFSSAVQDRTGVLLRLALAKDDRYRLKVPLDTIAASAIDATLLYEDQHFRTHPGFDVAALLRATWSTYISRERVVGGSTITMQLARLRFALDTRSIQGKLQQIARAVQLERHYSKDQILEAYLNLAPYGGNIEGIGTAALIYFDKPAARLSLPEALALVVIPQNPVGRNPTRPRGKADLHRAQARLAELWTRKFGLSKEQQAQVALPLVFRDTSQLPYRAPHFSRAVLRNASRHGEPMPGISTTTLHWPTQRLLEERISHYVDRLRSRGITNASAMLVDYRTMAILAAVGSADFFNAAIQGQVDGTQAKRSPGSTLKPFVYGLALDQGLIHPKTLLKDAPKRFAAYTPENFDRGFMGPISAQDALTFSRNVPAIDLLAKVGHTTFNDFLGSARVADLRSAEHYGLAMVLGGNELTMRELVRLYAMLANGGEHKPLQHVLERQAQIELTDTATERPPGLLSAEASFLVLDMLRHNPRPDAVDIKTNVRQQAVAWKTGTSYAFRDAWTVGVFGPYVLAVWVGNFDGSGNPALVGRKAAAPLFFEIADALPLDAQPLDAQLLDTELRGLKRTPPAQLNLVEVDVCASTGDLPGRHCPHSTKGWFIPGVSPITVSNVHRAVRIDVHTGARTCRFDPATTREEVFEFWPSDIARLFQQAGIPRRQPPPWSSDCSLDIQAANGQAPRITSPAARLAYQVRIDKTGEQPLPLIATTDGDVQWLFWFANDTFIAKVPRDKPFFWTPDAGEYDILVVDDLGRSHSQSVSVKTVL